MKTIKERAHTLLAGEAKHGDKTVDAAIAAEKGGAA